MTSAKSLFELLHKVNHYSGSSVFKNTHNVAMAERYDRIIDLVYGIIASEILK